jgi:predicted nucleic acid-binding Zn finger protein
MTALFQGRKFVAVALVFLFAHAHAADTQVQVLSATIKDQKIPGATVILQHNGAQSVSVTTDAQGNAPLPQDQADDSSALIIIKKDGYSNLIAKCPCSGLSYALSPVMQNLDGLRVVLSWGAQPPDLDLHVAYPSNHVYWRNRQGTDSNLDIDHVDSYGPETITLERKHTGDTYVFAVHDYTDRNNPGTDALSNSQAKVFVYVGQSLVRSYYVPRNQAGNLWTVFRINGNGDFQDINTMRGVKVDAENVLDEINSYNNAQMQVVAANQTGLDPVRAKALNHQGETAYHAGNLDQATDLFRQAIDLDPNYGQAYSNLGLVYQKAGRAAEAIWADRKAIALASGATAPTVRASSYYNIGRLYEDADQFDNALNNYRAAKNEKANPVYDNAIQRVSNHH